MSVESGATILLSELILGLQYELFYAIGEDGAKNDISCNMR